MEFINRINELSKLNSSKGGLIVLFGRRRVGKTALVEKWAEGKSVFYSQAIEAAPEIQINQLSADLASILPDGFTLRNWSEFFSALNLIKKNLTIVIDEFPYLVKVSPELPSLTQRWIDHKKPANLNLILLGSSQTMMHSIFLQSNAPLYERASEIIHLEPLTYKDFCKALHLDPEKSENFELFSITGGVPKYWEFLNLKQSASENANHLYFNKSARLENEPERLMKDENISGLQAKSMLECIGRGATKPSEVASRLGIAQSSLSPVFQSLRQASLIDKQSPFPEQTKESKKVLYFINDFALRFWYQIYSPHRSRWHLYKLKEKNKLIHDYASTVLEDCFRNLFIDAARYWEGKDIEIDFVRYNPDDLKSVIISEIKHTKLSKENRAHLQKDLEFKFNRSQLARKFKLARVEVLDTVDVLNRISEDT